MESSLQLIILMLNLSDRGTLAIIGSIAGSSSLTTLLMLFYLSSQMLLLFTKLEEVSLTLIILLLYFIATCFRSHKSIVELLRSGYLSF